MFGNLYQRTKCDLLLRRFVFRTLVERNREKLVMKRKGPREGEWEEAKRLACLILHVFRCAQIYIKRVTSRQLIQLFRLDCQEAYVTKP